MPDESSNHQGETDQAPEQEEEKNAKSVAAWFSKNWSALSSYRGTILQVVGSLLIALGMALLFVTPDLDTPNSEYGPADRLGELAYQARELRETLERIERYGHLVVPDSVKPLAGMAVRQKKMMMYKPRDSFYRPDSVDLDSLTSLIESLRKEVKKISPESEKIYSPKQDLNENVARALQIEKLRSQNKMARKISGLEQKVTSLKSDMSAWRKQVKNSFSWIKAMIASIVLGFLTIYASES